MAEDGVLLLLLAKLVGVEGDVLEHAFAGILELGAVGFFDDVKRLINALTIAWLMAKLVESVETGIT
ncbi:hypothetical protein D3C77_727100 [compost metagenome]